MNRLMTALFVVLIVALLASWPTAQQPGSLTAPAGSLLKLSDFEPSNYRIYNKQSTEIIRWSPASQTLTVTERAPRELLVCLRGRCKLVEEWLEK